MLVKVYELPVTRWLTSGDLGTAHDYSCAVLCLVTQLGPTLCDLSLPGSSIHGDSPGKNTGMSCHVLLQGIFPTQESNPGLPHWGQNLYHLSHQGSPRILEWVAYPFSRGSSRPRNWIGVSYFAGRLSPVELPGKPGTIVNTTLFYTWNLLRE